MYQELKNLELYKRMDKLSLAVKQTLYKRREKKQPHIVYVMTNIAITGGVKVILEHTNQLVQQGIKVSIVTHFEKPDWYTIEAEFIQVPFTIELAKGIPNCDVIVATYWDHIQSCEETGIAPVVYFEQGDFHIFEYDLMQESLKNFIHKQFEIPSFIFTVSKQTASLIKAIYGRDAKVIHNAIEKAIFRPKSNEKKPYILIMGSEYATFKRITDIIKAYKLIKRHYNFDLYWITPEEPSQIMKRSVTKYFIQPEQSKIAELFQNAKIYVSASEYESFSLPPLEAMACGCPVVTAGNHGVLEYAIDNYNALVTKIGDVTDIVNKVKKVLDNEDIENKLIKNGLITANKFNWETITKKLLSYYRVVAAHEVQQKNKLKDWDITVDSDSFLNAYDYQKFLKFLQRTPANIIKIPVIYEVGGLIHIARWEVVANNKKSHNTKEDFCYCPAYPFNSLALLNEKGYRAIEKREFEVALQEFATLNRQTTESKFNAIYTRWEILCLYWLQRKNEAKNIFDNWLVDDPYFSEWYYLKNLLDNHEEDWKLTLLGDAVNYPEFIYSKN